jgi:predicted metal-dependent peptidase
LRFVQNDEAKSALSFKFIHLSSRKNPHSAGKATLPVSIDTELSRCVNQLLLKEPFYAHILSGTVRNISEIVPTAAVGLGEGQVMLFINPQFFLKELRSTSQRIAVLKHETLHLIFKHLFRDLLQKDAELMNISADIVVNQYIGNWDLPSSAITLSTFPDLELEEGQTMEYYYERLEELKKDCEQNNHEAVNNKSDAGDNKSEGRYPESQGVFREIYGKGRHSDHSRWADGSVATGAAEQIGLQEALENQLLNAASRVPVKQYGTIPGEIIRIIDGIRERRKPRIDWKRQLRLFASSHGKSYAWHTMKRISKRYGTRPGIRIKRTKHIIVIIDTSGSINDEVLQLFLAEIDGIYRAGSSITLIESDAEVQSCYTYRRGKAISCKGGGGTNFTPAFEYINSGKAGIADACIYLTDGYAPEPEVKPRSPLLWVLTPDGSPGNHLKWGRTLMINQQ